MEIKPIAHFRSPFSSKFGIPKQAGLVAELEGQIVFEPEYRNPDALRGMEGFDYLWLIWEFSANKHKANSPVVRPPVLGGNEKVGVFATRSPFRPNNIGLSSVRISGIEWETSKGPVIHVKGADLMDMTPIYDIKPYIAYTDSHADAVCGFVDKTKFNTLNVKFTEGTLSKIAPQKAEVLKEILSNDPRPAYDRENERIYGFKFAHREIKFKVEGKELTVLSIENE